MTSKHRSLLSLLFAYQLYFQDFQMFSRLPNVFFFFYQSIISTTVKDALSWIALENKAKSISLFQVFPL